MFWKTDTDTEGQHLSRDADPPDTRLTLAEARLLLAINPIPGMDRTAVNVVDKALVGVVMAKHEGILDKTIYYRKGLLVA